MGNIRSFKELRVWQNAIDVAMIIFELTKSFPVEERFSLTDQIRRSDAPSSLTLRYRVL